MLSIRMTLMSSPVGLDTVAFNFTSDDLNELARGEIETISESAALGAANATATKERADKSLKDIGWTQWKTFFVPLAFSYR